MQLTATVIARLVFSSAVSFSAIQVSRLAAASTIGSARSRSATASGIGSSRHKGRSAQIKACARPAR